MNRPLVIALLVAAVATWTVETTNRARLMKRLDLVRQTNRALPRVRAEHEALVRRQPFVGEVDGLRRDRAELIELRRERAQREPVGSDRDAALAALGRELLPMAVWLPTSGMRDLGRGTPHATLQTLLWAAGAGNIHALKEAIAFEPAERQQAGEIVTRLPLSAGLQYAAPEMLIAHSLAKQPPAGEIQLLAEELKGFDEAAEYIAWRTPAGIAKVLYLRLRWEPGGWRVVVPGHAVENAGRILAGTPPVIPVDPYRDAPQAPEP